MSEQRLAQLELLFMEQSATLEALSEQVYWQQKELLRLSQELQQVKQRMKNMNVSLVASAAEETPPPHY